MKSPGHINESSELFTARASNEMKTVKHCFNISKIIASLHGEYICISQVMRRQLVWYAIHLVWWHMSTCEPHTHTTVGHLVEHGN